MKTVELDDESFRQAELAAAERGITVREFIESQIRGAVMVSKQPISGRRVEFPIIKSKNPGRVITSEEVYRILEELDEEEALDDAYPNRR